MASIWINIQCEEAMTKSPKLSNDNEHGQVMTNITNQIESWNSQ
jgi:hypothetical protein